MDNGASSYRRFLADSSRVQICAIINSRRFATNLKFWVVI